MISLLSGRLVETFLGGRIFSPLSFILSEHHETAKAEGDLAPVWVAHQRLARPLTPHATLAL